jgi:hypothetical protein
VLWRCYWLVRVYCQGFCNFAQLNVALHFVSGRFGWGSVPPERAPKRGGVSAYEQSLKDYVDRMSAIVISPSVGMSFDSRAEAYEFYNLHSWELGFGIRCNMTVDKSVVSQDIVCSCEVRRCSACVFVTLYNSVFQFQDMQCGLTVKIVHVCFRANQSCPTLPLCKLIARL